MAERPTVASVETFVVEELPAYEPSGEGEHTFLWIEKRPVCRTAEDGSCQNGRP